MKGHLPFSQIKKTRLYEEVADQIKKAIFDGELKPGDRLPSERELCKVFGVGRPAIREALRTLSVMGLIEVNTGVRGSFIKEVNITQYLEAVREQLAWLIKLGEDTVQELWEVRKYMEIGIAHLAARNATPDDFEELDRLMEEMDACGDDIYAYFPIAVEFHRKLAMATKNRVFFVLWEIFEDILLKGYTPILDKLFPEGPVRLREPNRVLLQAIKSGDLAAIDKAMDLHADEEKSLPENLETEEKKPGEE